MATEMVGLVVTRHPGLLEVLQERDIAPAGIKVLAHATADDVRGRHVAGVLPLALAAEAESVTEITLNLPVEARGRELNAAEVRQYMTGISRYVVRRG